MKQKNTSQSSLFSDSENKVWTISELTAQVRAILEDQFSPIKVSGEISRITRASSGHLYFQLKDTRSAIDAVMFRSAAVRTARSVAADGVQVECLGRMTMYEPRGKAQFVIEAMRPQGEGALALRLLELKQRLLDEGLFDQDRKKDLPFIPQAVGVVTSPTGAAIRDILKVMGRRFPSIPVIIAPALVQGSLAAGQIANSIHLLESTGRVDVIIVGRGGGSLEDLWAFNEEELVRAVAECSIPIISAVGHETDFVLSDLAADLRAPTPSAAAELVVPDREELAQMLDSLTLQMTRAVERKSAQARADIQQMQSKLQDPRLVLAHHRMRLDDIIRTISTIASAAISSRLSTMAELRVKLAAFEPDERLRREQQKIQNLHQRLTSFMEHSLAAKLASIESRRDAIVNLSPLAVLNRGYSLVFGPDGNLVRDAGMVNKGDLLKIRPARGKLEARVEASDEDKQD